MQCSASRDGSAISGLMLANGLREAGWQTLVAFGHRGPMEQEYQAAGHQTMVLEHKSWLRRSHLLRFLKDMLMEWRCADKFEEVLREQQPDAVYVNSAVSLAGVVAARRLGLPVVWHLRELFDEVGGELRPPTLFRPLVRRLFARLPDRVVTNSRAVADNLLGSRADSAIVIHNAVDDSFFDIPLSSEQAREELGLPRHRTIVGVPGTLRPVKGHPFFFEAAAIISRKHPELCLAISGDGEANYVQSLKQQVSDLGLADRTRFLGALPDLKAFYRACDIICVPSKSETFGRVVIEAMAAGVPVVASDVGGISEILADGEAGLLVPFGDVSALSHALVRCIGDAGFAAQQAENGRMLAKQRFTETGHVAAVSEVIAQLVAGIEPTGV